MQNLHPDDVATPIGVASETDARLQLALTDISQAAREGLLAMSASVGMAVTAELMEAEETTLAGLKGAHVPDRRAYRHGHTDGEVTLGARRVKVRRYAGLRLNVRRGPVTKFYSGRDNLRRRA